MAMFETAPNAQARIAFGRAHKARSDAFFAVFAALFGWR